MKVEELAGATEGRPTNTPPDITATTIPANGQVAAMGYMPSCKVAQAALGAIDPACPQLNLKPSSSTTLHFLAAPLGLTTL